MHGTRLVAALACTAVLFAGCGEEARSTRPAVTERAPATDNDGDVSLDVSTPRSVDLPDGWHSAAWEELGGRPEAWPADLVPPVDTVRATLASLDRGEQGEGLILNGRVPSSLDEVVSELEDRFSSWERVAEAGGADVVGRWERGGDHVTVTARPDGDDGATWGIILRER